MILGENTVLIHLLSKKRWIFMKTSYKFLRPMRKFYNLIQVVNCYEKGLFYETLKIYRYLRF